jgi:hypothetical protein
MRGDAPPILGGIDDPNGVSSMKTLVTTFVAVAATLLATSAFAEGKTQYRAPSALAPIANEPAPKLIVEAPLPGALARGVAIVPYHVENIRIVPVLGADAIKLSPRVGHLHVTLNDLPWHWADFGGTNAIVVAPLPPGPHKLLIELADPQHRVITGQSVTFTVPARAE